MPSTALFVTSFHQSLGETFTLARLAHDLRAEGWRVEFLASEFAAAFLRQQGHAVTLLGGRRDENERLLTETVKRLEPSVAVTADFFLFEATDARQKWSVRWLTEGRAPVVTFDHLKFHPHPRTITLAFKERFASDPDLVKTFAGVPAGAAPRIQVRVPALPAEVAALIRPCPVHDPRPQPDARVWCYDVCRGEPPCALPAATRRRLGLASTEKVVVVPVGSWALDLSRHLRLPYPDLLARSLLRYFRRVSGPLRVLLVGTGLAAAKEVRGRVTLELVPGLPFDDFRDLLAASDLVLGDNATSATLGRGVMAGVPTAVLTSALVVRRERGRIVLDAPFPVSPFVRKLIRSAERSAPGSVFPFAVYPLGWREEMEPLFAGNPYRNAVEWLEMFDEKTCAERLASLLGDQVARGSLIARQRAYRRLVAALPAGGRLLSDVLDRSVGAVA